MEVSYNVDWELRPDVPCSDAPVAPRQPKRFSNRCTLIAQPWLGSRPDSTVMHATSKVARGRKRKHDRLFPSVTTSSPIGEVSLLITLLLSPWKTTAIPTRYVVRPTNFAIHRWAGSADRRVKGGCDHLSSAPSGSSAQLTSVSCSTRYKEFEIVHALRYKSSEFESKEMSRRPATSRSVTNLETPLGLDYVPATYINPRT